MNKKNNPREKIVYMTRIAFLAALIVVLQLMSSLLVKFGLFNLSLVLVPIVLGGIIFGPKSGALLGAVFGAIVSITSITGLDAGGAMMFTANPIVCVLLCFVKGIACGFVPAFLYKLISKQNKKSTNNIAIILSSGLCPIVNTSLFLILANIFFYDILCTWANGEPVLSYLLNGIIIANFLPEFLLNIIICPILTKALYSTKMFKLS